jgi:hypothetical protein
MGEIEEVEEIVNQEFPFTFRHREERSDPGSLSFGEGGGEA